MQITSRALTAAGAVALVLVLGACGGDDEPDAAQSPSTSPSTTTEAAESPSDESGTEGSETGSETGSEEDAAAFLERLKAGMGEEGSLHVEMTMAGPIEMDASGDTTYGPDGSEMHLEMTMSNLPGGAMEMVLVDGTAYMSMPGVTAPGTFFEVDQSNPMFGQLDDGLSPADSFAAFDAGLQEVEDLGADEIDGDEVTHYRLEVDAAEALKATGQGTVPGLPETLSYDVWLDEDDRMRRLTYELTGTELTMDMTDWGKPVTIEAPEKVVEAPPMM